MSARIALGLDVGGTKIRGGRVDLETGAVSDVEEIATPPRGATGQITEAVRALITNLAARGAPPIGIGIGLPELVSKEGRPQSDWVCNWRDLEPQMLTDLAVPVRLDSDVRCGARAELRFGDGQGYRDFSYVSIGSGISAVQCIGGHLHTGARGFAIHFGSTPLVSLRDTGGSESFTLEDRASGLGIASLYTARGGQSDLAARALLERTDDPLAREVIGDAVLAMASYLGQMVNMLDPEALILGGGLGRAPAYLALLRATLPRFIWAEERRNLPVLPARIGADAGLVGAALGLAADAASH